MFKLGEVWDLDPKLKEKSGLNFEMKEKSQEKRMKKWKPKQKEDSQKESDLNPLRQGSEDRKQSGDQSED